MVDHVPLDPAGPTPPRPQLRTLTLLVGRMTTIKLTYWAALTAWEIAAPRGLAIAFAVLASAAAVLWAIRSARNIDIRSGGIARSIATVSTTFATASVVAAPASIPLLLVERVRSAEGCAAQITCHGEAIWFWVATFLIGFIVIPAAFAIALKSE
ncbi:MAG: hypothetical protein NVSMB8_05310 [Candidatus Limnocylindrales bacterium]